MPLRPSENIRQFENQTFVHCLVSMFFNVLTLIKYQCSKLNTNLDTIFLSEWGYCVYIEIPLRLSPTPAFGALKKYERSDVTLVNIE